MNKKIPGESLTLSGYFFYRLYNMDGDTVEK